MYSGPISDRHRHGGGGTVTRALLWLLTIGVIGLNIAWALAEGEQRRDLTIASVLVFFAASTLHAMVERGYLWTLGFLVVAVGGGLAWEAVGVATGWPFGDYAYDPETLGPTVWDVPVVIPLAWAMMAYPCLIAARRLATGFLVTPLIGALALAAWDLFLDPMMVAEGYWSFTDPEPALPHVPGVPYSNYAGWYLAAFVLMLLLDRLPRRRGTDDRVPAVLFLWTYVSSVVGNLFVFDRPWVALYGGIAMGLVAVPYAAALWLRTD